MQQFTCPNCNVDADQEVLRQNNLRCPTCGFDFSDTAELQAMNEDWVEQDSEEDLDEGVEVDEGAEKMEEEKKEYGKEDEEEDDEKEH